MLTTYVPLQGSFFRRNSSRAIQPPPTRTMTVLRRMRTNRNFWLSPNCKQNITLNYTHIICIDNVYIFPKINLKLNFFKMIIKLTEISLTLYFPSPTWKTLNFCLHVHSITKRLTSSWIFCASWSGFFSSQSGLSAAINSFQSIKPLLLRSNMSATSFISRRFVSNSKKIK